MICGIFQMCFITDFFFFVKKSTLANSMFYSIVYNSQDIEAT